MLKFRKSDRIDFLHYQDLIASKGYIYVDPKDIAINLAYDKTRYDTLVSLCIREMVAEGGFLYGRFDKDTVLNFLVDVLHVDSKDLVNRKNKNEDLSLSRKVLERLATRASTKTFIELYMEQSSVKFINGRIAGMLGRLEEKGEVGRDDNPISRLKYSVGQQDNFRYNYFKDDIISIPKEYTRRFTVPKGYFLAWGDLKQSDFRIACNLVIIDESNYHYFDNSDDWYESIYRLLCDFYNRPFDRQVFLDKRNLMKETILSAVYGAESGKTDEATEFIREFSRYLDTCPRYKEFKDRIDKYLSYKVPVVVDTYFGNQVSVPTTTDIDTRNKTLNTPFQSGTSEIVIKIVTAIMDKFYSLGYTDDDVRVYVVRHDEPVFMLSEEAIKDAWVLEDCKEIYVDSWRPLGLDFSYGYYYGIKDQELTNKIEESIRSEIYRIEFHEPDKEFVPYMPLKRIKRLSLGYAETFDDKVLVTIFDKERNEAVYYTAKSHKVELGGKLVEVVPWKILIKAITDFSENFEKMGIEDILIDTYFKFTPEILKNGILLIPNESSAESSLVNAISECKAWAHCEQENKLYRGDLNVISSNKEFADNVVRVDALQG